jgi:hypothetical protein
MTNEDNSAESGNEDSMPDAEGSEDDSPAATLLRTVRSVGPNPRILSSGAMNGDERELIRRAIHAFKTKEDLDMAALVQLIQFKRATASYPNEDIVSNEMAARLWSTVTERFRQYRKSRSVVEWVRRTYILKQRAGRWTEEEDIRLEHARQQYPKNWAPVAALVGGGRSASDCHFRWRDNHQYGNQRNIMRWSSEEERRLCNIVDNFTQKNPNTPISWVTVAKEMDGTRSRGQCLYKWKQLVNEKTSKKSRISSARTQPTPSNDTESASEETDSEETDSEEESAPQLSQETEIPVLRQYEKLNVATWMLMSLCAFDVSKPEGLIEESDMKIDFTKKEANMDWAVIKFCCDETSLNKPNAVVDDPKMLWYRIKQERGGDFACFADAVVKAFLVHALGNNLEGAPSEKPEFGLDDIFGQESEQERAHLTGRVYLKEYIEYRTRYYATKAEQSSSG